jgi:hypothetical protein
MPDPDPPPSGPLSESEADRLSERFTASWDDPVPTTVEPAAVPTAPVPASPPPSPPPSPAPRASVAPASATKQKQTLLGIAPIVVVGPSQPPPAAAKAVAPAPVPVPVPVPVAEPVPVPVAAPDMPAPAPAAAAPPPPPPAPLPPPPSSSPDASGVAQGLTTPAKPYVPKDDPSTPAVVINESALAESQRHQAEQERADRSRVTQPIPTHRSAPSASAAPVPLVAAVASSSIVDDTYPAARRRGSKLPLILGGLALAAGGALAFAKFAGSRPSSEANPAAAAPPPAEPSPTPPAEAAPPPEPAAAATTPAQPQAATPPPPEPVAAAPKRGKVRRPAAAPSPRRPASVTAEAKAAAAPASEPTSPPTPQPTPKPAKGVIVRETPF